MECRDIVCFYEIDERVLLFFLFVILHDDFPRVDGRNRAVFFRDDDAPGVFCRTPFYACCDIRRARDDARNRLFLHVGTHERAVGVIVFEERYERCCDGKRLVRGDIYKVDFLFAHKADLARLVFRAHLDEIIRKEAVFYLHGGVSDVVSFFKRVQIHYLLGDFSVRNFNVRGFR